MHNHTVVCQPLGVIQCTEGRQQKREIQCQQICKRLDKGIRNHIVGSFVSDHRVRKMRDKVVGGKKSMNIAYLTTDKTIHEHKYLYD